MTTATQATRNSPTLHSGQGVRDWFQKAGGIIKNLGPYAAIEFVLPGGSVIAVLLWLYRRSKLIERSTSDSAGSAIASNAFAGSRTAADAGGGGSGELGTIFRHLH